MRQGSGVVFFVSGTGTDVGKTVATGLMARWLLAMGRDVITVKLVQTGNVGRSEDIEAHRRLMGGVRFPEDDAGLTAPQIFEFPSSPLLAARLEGKSVDVAKIVDSVEACAAAHEVVLVEGAGGLDHAADGFRAGGKAVERQLAYYVKERKLKDFVLKVSPIFEAYLTKGFNSIRRKWCRKYGCKIKIVGDSDYSLLKATWCNAEGEPIE